MVLFMKLVFGPAAVFLSALVILSCFTNVPYLSYSDLPYYKSYISAIPKCDIFQGEWVPDMESPQYTNETCSYIQEHQNCMMYGRPDLEFLKWRWQPSRCELPRFDPDKFLRLVGNKTLAFFGDSLARNHMQSLLCLLSKVASPKDVSVIGKTDPNKILYYEGYNFTIKIFWSPFLVRTEESAESPGVFKLYLDEADDKWFSNLASLHYLILSGANWFTRPSMFYEKGQLVGASYVRNVSSTLTLRYSHRMAFRTTLRAINGHGNFKGKAIVRTLSPMSHFEGGPWHKGGDCRRSRPYRGNETAMNDLEVDFYTAQMEEFREAEQAAAAAGVDMALMDPTGAMLLRPDGHPSRYGHWPDEKRVLYNDCIHWCLPGPVDAWNDMLLHVMSD